MESCLKISYGKGKYLDHVTEYFYNYNGDINISGKIEIYRIILGVPPYNIDWPSEFYERFLKPVFFRKLLSDLEAINSGLLRVVLCTFIRVLQSCSFPLNPRIRLHDATSILIKHYKNLTNAINATDAAAYDTEKSHINYDTEKSHINYDTENSLINYDTENSLINYAETSDCNSGISNDTNVDLIELILIAFQSQQKLIGLRNRFLLINILIRSLEKIFKEDDICGMAIDLIGQIIERSRDIIARELESVEIEIFLRFLFNQSDVSSELLHISSHVLKDLCNRVLLTRLIKTNGKVEQKSWQYLTDVSCCIIKITKSHFKSRDVELLKLSNSSFQLENEARLLSNISWIDCLSLFIQCLNFMGVHTCSTQRIEANHDETDIDCSQMIDDVNFHSDCTCAMECENEQRGRIYSSLAEVLTFEQLQDGSDCDDSVWLASLFATMVYHQGDIHKQQAACRTLADRIQSNPTLCNLIGEENNQVGIHSAVMAALNIYLKDPFVFKATCDVIFEMGVNSECLQRHLIVRGAYVTILNEIKSSSGDSEMRAFGYRALRGLAYQNPLLEEVIFKYGIFNLIEDDINLFNESAFFLKEVLPLLTSLATDLQIIRRQCLSSGLPQTMMKVLENHRNNRHIINVGLECIAIFCASEETQLRNLKTVQTLNDITGCHMDNDVILQKICVVMQLMIFDEDFLEDNATVHQILVLLKKIWNECECNDSLLIECCVLLTLMLETSALKTSMSVKKLAVQLDININLLEIVENFPSYEPIYDFACQCLSAICLQRDLCDVTFLRCCHLGFTKTALYLSNMDAKIDIEFDEYEPCICVAARNGNMKLAELALSKGTTHACRALRIALDERQFDVAGTILRHLGYERENASISWSAMQISELNAEMFFSTISSSLDISNTEVTQVAVQKRQPNGRRKRSISVIAADEAKSLMLNMRRRSKSLLDEDSDNKLIRTLKTTSGISLPYNARDPRLAVEKLSEKHVVLTSPTKDVSYPGQPDVALFSEPSVGIFTTAESNLNDYVTASPRKRVKFRKSISEDTFRDVLTSTLSTTSLVRSPSTPLRDRTRSCLPAFYQNKMNIIKYLDISHNYITDLTSIGQCPSRNFSHFIGHLSYMDISSNRLQAIPECLCKRLKTIKSFTASRNQIKEFPYSLLCNTAIEIVDLSSNEIAFIERKKLKASLSMLKLDLSNNKLKDFPCWVSEIFPRLTRLFLSQNEIKEIPADAPGFRGLNELKLNANKLKHIPASFFSQCVSLEKLDLSKNELESLPECTMSSLCRLTSIKLAYNKLKGRSPYFIPKVLLSLKTIQIIDLSHNEIEQVPDPIYWSSRNIRELRFDYNRVTLVNLSANAGQFWPSISRLSFRNNVVQNLSPNIGELSSLVSLDISHNRITKLPNELGLLKHLCDFQIHGLKLKLHPGLKNGTSRDIIYGLKAKLKKAVPYHRIRLMLVGKGGRGKTSLIRRLAQKKPKSSNIATVGVEVGSWMLKRSGFRCNQSILINYWDFGGQEDFYSTHQYFLHSRALYIAVFDCSKGVEEMNFLTPWLLNIKAVAPGAGVFLIGTHADKIPSGKRDSHSKLILNHAKAFFEKPGMPKICGKALVNTLRESPAIQKLREKLLKVISELRFEGERLIGQMVPKSYLDLEELVEKEAITCKAAGKLPVLTKQTLSRLVSKHCLQLNGEEFDVALKFLKQTGALMHFADGKFNLNSLYFIDPPWLCKMMAKVVTVKEVNPFITDRGILSKDDAKILFHNENYPDSFLDQYFRLLQKFEILLPISSDKYLITCRISSDMPQYLITKSEEIVGRHNSLQRRYAFPYVPTGFWSRLITRTLIYSGLSSVNVGMDFWSRGIYVSWTDDVYMLLISTEENTIDIYLPSNQPGYKTLGTMVDLIDNLIEEWYPGLDIATPCLSYKVDRLAACYACNEDVHYFELSYIIECSYDSDSIECPNCGPVLIEAVAPDVVFAEINRSFIIPECEIAFNDDNVRSLGTGSFASVYKVTVEGEPLAVKVFSNGCDGASANRLLRQELEILSKLHHPCLITFVGVTLRPRMILLEYAPLGNLQDIIDSGRCLSRGMQHRICLQITEGLAYLHKYGIVYRDMKLSNILVFSLSMGVLVNVKLSDYGISQFAGVMDLHACKGTPGYQAPEIVQYGSEYNSEVDIFSLGVTIYKIVTHGKQPFGDVAHQNEFDRVALSKRPPDSMSTHGIAPWPDVEEVIAACLLGNPDERPSIDTVLEKLSGVELLSLQRVLPICKSQTVECLALRKFVEENAEKLELWIGSGEAGSQSQLSWLPLHQCRKQSVQGIILTEGRILCMEIVGKEVFVGTKEGSVVAIDCNSKTKMYELPTHMDSVLCLKYISTHDLLVAGLANGFLCAYKGKDLTVSHYPLFNLNCNGLQSKIFPVTCMTSHANTLLIGYGSELLEISLPKFDISRRFPFPKENLINSIVMGRKRMFVSFKNKKNIIVMDVPTFEMHPKQIDVADILEPFITDITSHECRVVSTHIPDNETLWIGCGGGFSLLIDISSEKYEFITLLRRHSTAVRSIISSPGVNGKSGVVITGSKGYRQCFDVQNNDGDDGGEFGYVLVWDADIPKQKHHLLKDIMMRKDLAEKLV